VNGIVILSMILLSVNILLPAWGEDITNPLTRSVFTAVISFGAASPFLWALMAKKPNNPAYRELWLEKKYNRGPLLVIEIIYICNVAGALSYACGRNPYGCVTSGLNFIIYLL
jgi:CPA2 family monovalent cation:H+ antiporter-2